MIQTKIKLRGSNLFISVENLDIRKYFVVWFTQSKTVFTPLFVGKSPPCTNDVGAWSTEMDTKFAKNWDSGRKGRIIG